MKKQQKFIHYGKETDAFYIGASSNEFTPISSGISFPDPSYRMWRMVSKIYVFEYVISGKGYVTQDSEQFTVHAGDAYILHPGKEHYYLPDEKEPWSKVWFNVQGSLVRHLLADYGMDQTLLIPGFKQQKYLDDIFHTMKEDPLNSRLQLALKLHQYIQALSAFCAELTDIPLQAVAMKKFIEQSLTRPLSIDEIAASVHLSRSRAMHLFKETYGISPYRYYQTQRLELAQSMLQHSFLSAQEISDQMGFSGYHHFSGFFKKECGISPTQYRQNVKNEQ